MRRPFKIATGVSVPVILVLALIAPFVFALHDPNGLGFDASLNQSTVSQGQTVTVTLTERNKLLVSNDLPLVANWRVENLSMGPCNFDHPFGIALYQGRYTVDNVSIAKSIMIYAPGTYFCGLAIFRNSFRLGPLQTFKDSVNLKGYWTEGFTPQPGGGVSPGILHPFTPGLYTLAAGDLWGHFVLRYFTVLD